METLARWALLHIGGLPEPSINEAAYGNGRKLGTPDMSYRSAALGIEYEGDGHRTNRLQWRSDITRTEIFAANGWRLMRITDADLFPDPWPFLHRVAAHLQRAGVPLPRWKPK